MRGLWIATIVFMLAGCEGRPQGWVVRVLEAHGLADEALARGDGEGARRSLGDALAWDIPSSVAEADGRGLRQDLHFRLAGLDLKDGAPQQALAWAEEGLALGRGEDIFTANLLIVRGKSLEALGRDSEAARAYHEALVINEGLLERALDLQR